MLFFAAVIVGAVVVLLLIGYNKLVGMRQLTRNAWSDVDVYLKRRSELIPNLVQSVSGYAKYEQETLQKAIDARNRARLAQGSMSGRAAAEQQVSSDVVQVLAIAEAYPELKANNSFLDLQGQLTDTEKLIANARQYYNACVRDYNTLIEAFPTNIVAGIMAFKPAEFFELDAVAEREAPQVQGLP
jgi:LemA protein